MARIADVDIRLLRVFLAVAECEGFSAAQTVLNVGIPTISLHMAELERRLGFRLCSRGRAGFHLTERGKVAHEQTKALIASLDNYFCSITALKGYLAGQIRLGIVDGLITHEKCPVIPAIRRFNEIDHDVEIDLVVEERTELERQLLSGQLHAAIGPKVRSISGLSFHPLFKESHNLYCGRAHPLFDPSGGRLSLGALERTSFVMRRYNELFDSQQLKGVTRRARVNTMEGMLVLLLTGDYIGYLPDHFAARWVEAEELARINVPGTAYRSQHCIIMNATMKYSAAVDRLVSMLIDGGVQGATRTGSRRRNTLEGSAASRKVRAAPK